MGADRRDAAAITYGFKVEPGAAGWRWTAFDLVGRVAARGVAPSRALAAAALIRALSRV